MAEQTIPVTTVHADGTVTNSSFTFDRERAGRMRRRGATVQGILNLLAEKNGGTLDKATVVSWAEALLSHYPQYKGHWDGDDWQVQIITRKIDSKLGNAFQRGDVSLVKRPSWVGGPRTAFSFRNLVNTSYS